MECSGTSAYCSAIVPFDPDHGDGCQNGWLTSYACSHRKLTYEVTDQGYGWYYFHHHHMHVSFNPPSYSTSTPMSLDPKCLIESCDAKPWNDFLGAQGLLER